MAYQSPRPSAGRPLDSSSPRPPSTFTQPVAATPISCSLEDPHYPVLPALFWGGKRRGRQTAESVRILAGHFSCEIDQRPPNFHRPKPFFFFYFFFLLLRLTVLAGSVQQPVRYTIWLNDTTTVTSVITVTVTTATTIIILGATGKDVIP